MRRSSLLLGFMGAVAAIFVATGLIAGGYLAGRGVMASRIGDPVVAVGVLAKIESPAGSAYAMMPVAAPACDAQRAAERIERGIQRMIDLLQEIDHDSRPAAI